MQNKNEISGIDKIKLSPVQSTGDCGYHVVVIGLFYLALKAAKEQPLASAINTSKAISKLLEEQPDSLKRCLSKEFGTNQECLVSYLEAMTVKGFEQITFNEILSHFTSQLKEMDCGSAWLSERIKNEIKSGLWIETNREWETLPAFKLIMKKIQLKADALYENACATKTSRADGDFLFEILFQAQIETCNTLGDDELTPAVKEVISRFYAKDAPKVWVDSEFLKNLVTHLLGSSETMFDKQAVAITSEGPSNNHWYIDLPNDEFAQKFISIYKSGYHSGLSIILPETRVEVPLSSFSSFFPSAPKNNTLLHTDPATIPRFN
ncbi:hypothetical protein OQJ18_13930 [Fluoribacter dumoffii]|uniref:hypothetical protein n=1 Tax=Fluoribacter dumoffii TaxID=463 RepID=UPI002244EE41|nr:hypothetical protein [Fluoribacter dumoffii]MCW8416803.1 hypothetical protein [Fluoribacter dumoffii]MCW8455357.1 hypothetical protein [Fluoribacter dumoffii]MCW8460565.1 hypothetical protein [Fluoribacter dumoffii]MCW8484046.1 hypothetical protein [Fluoribacter dumoffii]